MYYILLLCLFSFQCVWGYECVDHWTHNYTILEDFDLNNILQKYNHDQLFHKRSSSFDLLEVYDKSIQGENYVQLRKSIEKVQEMWEDWITDPVQVKIKYQIVELQEGVLASTFNYIVVLGYNSTREFLVNKFQDKPFTDWPVSPKWKMVAGVTPTDTLLWVSSLSKLFSNSPTIDSVIFISPNVNDNFDFTPEDGVDKDKIDFVSTLFHELGHALGFWSSIEISTSSGSLSPSILDVYRFDSSSSYDFLTSPRIVMKGKTHEFWDEKNRNSLETGERYGASHWSKDTRYFGIMQPTLRRGYEFGVTPMDIEAIQSVGWKTRVAVPLIFSNQVSGQQLKIRGMNFHSNVKCVFNDSYYSTPIIDSVWRSLQCKIPSQLKGSIFVHLTNDGFRNSEPFLIIL